MSWPYLAECDHQHQDEGISATINLHQKRKRQVDITKKRGRRKVHLPALCKVVRRKRKWWDTNMAAMEENLRQCRQGDFFITAKKTEQQ